MQNTRLFYQLKKAAADLVFFSDREDLLTLLNAAMASEEAKDFDADEIKEYFSAVQSIYVFLQELAILFGYNSMAFPAEYKNRSNFLNHKFEAATNDQVINLITDLFEKVPARKLVFDIYSVFTSAIDSEQFVKDRKLYAGISFSLKLINQFLRDYELIASFNVEERLFKGFMPVVKN